MTLLIRENLTDADLAWAAEAFRRPAPRPAAAPSPARGRVPALLGMASVAVAAVLALSANAGAAARPAAEPPAQRKTAAPAWTVERAVRDHLRADLANDGLGFSLVSAQSLRLPEGGRRFDGSGLAAMEGGETRFVAFTFDLDRDGQVSAFDYGLATGGDTAELVEPAPAAELALR